MPVLPLRLCVLPINVHHIGQQLEGIKRNADRKCDALHDFGDLSKNGTDQTGILEHTDQEQIHKHCQSQPHLPLAYALRNVDTQCAEPVYRRHQHQEQNILRLSPCVEYQGKKQQRDVLRFQAAAKHVTEQRKRQKRIDKDETRKNHVRNVYPFKDR